MWVYWPTCTVTLTTGFASHRCLHQGMCFNADNKQFSHRREYYTAVKRPETLLNGKKSGTYCWEEIGWAAKQLGLTVWCRFCEGKGKIYRCACLGEKHCRKEKQETGQRALGRLGGWCLSWTPFGIFYTVWPESVLPTEKKKKTCKTHFKKTSGASLVAQWLRVCLPMQGTRVRALVWEDPTCRGATGPVSHNCWAWASEASAPQQERPR